MNTKYRLVPRKIWQRKPGFTGCPAQVSIYGSLPSPREAYEIVENGYSVYDVRNNTYSNYFFGKMGIETEVEGLAIIEKLNK